ncbi:M23 family metallopeptidase [Microbacterium sp. M]|uniref:M23 family metallopeptidase n=1 Tax=Microbacterium sp. M TaxID=3377125 RepID=UPI00386DA26B
MATDIESPEKTSEDRTPARRGAGRSGRKLSVKKPLRSIAIFGAVGALVAAVALPAYASTTPTTEAATTLQQVAMDDAQSLVVASEATAAPMDRGNYSATTPDEIAQKKAEEAAAARAEAAAKAAAASSGGGGYNTGDVALVAPGSGDVRNPVGGGYYVSRTLSGSHNGADMVGDAGTPLYAAAAGTVRISTDSYYGYGVGVVIDHVLGGQQVSTLYGHMIYGSRQVQAGQTVQAGQLIGFMGSTGRSTANHLHFEVRIGGSLVEPIGWLNANGAPA